MKEREVGGEGEEELRRQDDPMPFMQAQVERIDLTERKEEHKEDQPRECGRKGQEEFIAKGSDEHREPKRVGVKEFTHI